MDMNQKLIEQFEELLEVAKHNGVEDTSITNHTYNDGTSGIELNITYKTPKSNQNKPPDNSNDPNGQIESKEG